DRGPPPTARRSPRPGVSWSRRSPNLRRDVVPELAELELPAAPVFLGVLRVLLLRAGEFRESALDHAQPCALALLGEAEFDEGRVALWELGAAGQILCRAQPVEGDEVRRIDPFDPPDEGGGLAPREGQLAPAHE